MNGKSIPHRQVVTSIRASAVLFGYLRSLPLVGNKKTWLIPANTCSVVPLTFRKAGRSVDIVDISPDDLCADVHILTKRIENDPERYEGVLLVDTFGFPKDWREFVAWLKTKYEICVMHDKCASVPVHLEDQPGVDAYLYSTGYAKYLDMGFGGFGYVHNGFPANSGQISFSPADLQRVDQICKGALAGRMPLPELPSDWLDASPLPVPEQTYFEQISRSIPAIATHKASLNKLYSERLPSAIQLPALYQQWRFNVTVPRKDILLRELFKRNLFASSHYTSLAGVFADGEALCTERFSANVVNLFNDFYYSEEQAALTIDVILKHLGK
jgi:hypothetical protein